MRRGRIEEASALAHRIGKGIVRHNSSRLSNLQGKADVKNVSAVYYKKTAYR